MADDRLSLGLLPGRLPVLLVVPQGVQGESLGLWLTQPAAATAWRFQRMLETKPAKNIKLDSASKKSRLKVCKSLEDLDDLKWALSERMW